MSILYLLVPITMLLTSAAVAAFAWSVRGGQLDDLTTPALRAIEAESAKTARAKRAEQPPRAS